MCAGPVRLEAGQEAKFETGELVKMMSHSNSWAPAFHVPVFEGQLSMHAPLDKFTSGISSCVQIKCREFPDLHVIVAQHGAPEPPYGNSDTRRNVSRVLYHIGDTRTDEEAIV